MRRYAVISKYVEKIDFWNNLNKRKIDSNVYV